MLNKGLFTSETCLWETPQDLFDSLDSEFHFTLDACALPTNAKCRNFYSPEQDGLSQPWTGSVWCNPPYGKEIGKWVKKAYDSSAGGGRKLLCSCLRGRIQNGFTITYMASPKFVS